MGVILAKVNRWCNRFTLKENPVLLAAIIEKIYSPILRSWKNNKINSKKLEQGKQ